MFRLDGRADVQGPAEKVLLLRESSRRVPGRRRFIFPPVLLRSLPPRRADRRLDLQEAFRGRLRERLREPSLRLRRRLDGGRRHRFRRLGEAGGAPDDPGVHLASDASDGVRRRARRRLAKRLARQQTNVRREGPARDPARPGRSEGRARRVERRHQRRQTSDETRGRGAGPLFGDGTLRDGVVARTGTRRRPRVPPRAPRGGGARKRVHAEVESTTSRGLAPRERFQVAEVRGERHRGPRRGVATLGAKRPSVLARLPGRRRRRFRSFVRGFEASSLLSFLSLRRSAVLSLSQLRVLGAKLVVVVLGAKLVVVVVAGVLLRRRRFAKEVLLRGEVRREGPARGRARVRPVLRRVAQARPVQARAELVGEHEAPLADASARVRDARVRNARVRDARVHHRGNLLLLLRLRLARRRLRLDALRLSPRGVHGGLRGGLVDAPRVRERRAERRHVRLDGRRGGFHGTRGEGRERRRVGVGSRFFFFSFSFVDLPSVRPRDVRFRRPRLDVRFRFGSRRDLLDGGSSRVGSRKRRVRRDAEEPRERVVPCAEVERVGDGGGAVSDPPRGRGLRRGKLRARLEQILRGPSRGAKRRLGERGGGTRRGAPRGAARPVDGERAHAPGDGGDERRPRRLRRRKNVRAGVFGGGGGRFVLLRPRGFRSFLSLASVRRAFPRALRERRDRRAQRRAGVRGTLDEARHRRRERRRRRGEGEAAREAPRDDAVGRPPERVPGRRARRELHGRALEPFGDREVVETEPPVPRARDGVLVRSLRPQRPTRVGDALRGGGARVGAALARLRDAPDERDQRLEGLALVRSRRLLLFLLPLILSRLFRGRKSRDGAREPVGASLERGGDDFAARVIRRRAVRAPECPLRLGDDEQRVPERLESFDGDGGGAPERGVRRLRRGVLGGAARGGGEPNREAPPEDARRGDANRLRRRRDAPRRVGVRAEDQPRRERGRGRRDHAPRSVSPKCFSLLMPRRDVSREERREGIERLRRPTRGRRERQTRPSPALKTRSPSGSRFVRVLDVGDSFVFILRRMFFAAREPSLGDPSLGRRLRPDDDELGERGGHGARDAVGPRPRRALAARAPRRRRRRAVRVERPEEVALVRPERHELRVPRPVLGGGALVQARGVLDAALRPRDVRRGEERFRRGVLRRRRVRAERRDANGGRG